MAYLVRSMFQRSYVSTEKQAEILACQYLAEIVLHELPESYQWARVIDCATQESKTYSLVKPSSFVHHDEFTDKDITIYQTQIMTL